MIARLIISMIHFYQRNAPDRIRNNCRYVPSCSEYMILAIQKYGWYKGVAMGINRLNRCKYPYGGEDYP
jgi:putative component of membrane protein insertase Oxa1/YidC/SpoIIIJ protein YidD